GTGRWHRTGPPWCPQESRTYRRRWSAFRPARAARAAPHPASGQCRPEPWWTPRRTAAWPARPPAGPGCPGTARRSRRNPESSRPRIPGARWWAGRRVRRRKNGELKRDGASRRRDRHRDAPKALQLKAYRTLLRVGYLAALVLKEQRGACRVGDNLCLVRQAVGDTAVLNGLDQVGRGGLPLGPAGARIRAGHLPLGNSHG